MFGDDVAAVLPDLQARAESLMTSTVRVETVAVTADPATGADLITPTTLVYSGKARVKGPTQASQQIPATTATAFVHFPATAVPIPVGARITVLNSTNPNIVGRVYRVTRSHLAEVQTAQRVEVESWL